MSDNVAITPGTGATVSTEEVTALNGGVVSAQHLQRISNAFRTGDGAAYDAATGAGAVGPSVQRMTLANDDPAVAALATLAGHVDGLETLLGSANTLATSLNGYVDGLEGYTDGIETLIGTTNTSLTSIAGYVDGLEALHTTLNGYVDGIEGLIGTTNTALTTLQGYVDGLETLSGTTNSLLTTQNGYLDGVETALATINTSIGSGTVGTGTQGSPNTTTILSVQGPGDTATPLRAVNPCDVVTVTPTLDTNAYAAGATLFTTTAITGAVRANDQRALLTSLVVIDKDDQKPAFKLFFFSSNVTFGTFNAVPSISDSDAGSFLGSVAVAAADYDDLGGVSVACIKNIGLMLEAVSAGTTVYVAAVVSTTPTHTASGLVLRFGLVQS